MKTHEETSVTRIHSVPLIPTQRCLGLRLWALGMTAAIERLTAVIASGQSGYGCFANAHMISESRQKPAVLQAMRAATWVFPDGKPVAKLLQVRGAKKAGQVPGPQVKEHLLAVAAQTGLPVYLFGGAESVLTSLQQQLPQRFPGLRIVGAHSPPFRAWTADEERADAQLIRDSGARLCLVALGCPKQELWMHRNAQATGCVCLGVGAAFPMLAGITPRAPTWVRKTGLEWAYRWAQEPRRLTHRYTVGNFRFLWAAQREIRTRRGGK
jgi:N-acetylglucosaminyldiphosphoundecaprenol N-acetyl-beta-D-mannosaminyltransferase